MSNNYPSAHFLVLIASFFAPLSVHGEEPSLTIWPASPSVGDQIAASVLLPSFCQTEFSPKPRIVISQANNVIRARFVRTSPGAGCSTAGADFDFMVGSLPGGSYQLEVEVEGSNLGRTSIDFEVSQRAPETDLGPSIDYSGLWWDSEDTGWALTLHQYQKGTVWASFLTFDSEGSSRWVMTLPGRWQNGLYTALLVEVREGPDVLSGSAAELQGRSAESEIVGELRISFAGYSDNTLATPFLGRMPLSAYLQYTFRGASHEKFLRRFELP